MLFNSYVFIFVFLPAALIVYFSLNHFRQFRLAKVWLTVSSLIFYGWWNVYYVPILLASIIINFAITQKLRSQKKNHENLNRKIIFLFGLIFNLSLLGYFKYRDFFIETTNQIFLTNFDLLHLALPLGISFFTLQQIAFLVDVYENLAEEPKFLDYAIFVSFFPQLIAGPIVHHNEMMPQFSSSNNLAIHYENMAKGLLIFFIGLFKKLVIADTFSEWATAGYDDSVVLTFIEAWATSISFTFQLYFDFSGYSDMAIGLALLFNINLPTNFNSPYKATSIIEFWSKWHITLTRFITTYIYTPIIRAFRHINFFNSMAATFLTMLIAGLWHGAAWTFILFGAIHGMALVFNHFWKKKKLSCPNVIGWFLTMNLVNISLVFFRANEWRDATKVLKGMAGLAGVVVTEDLIEALPFVKILGFYVGDHLLNLQADDDVFRMMFAAGIIVLFFKNSNYIKKSAKLNWLTLIFANLIFVVSILCIGQESPFLYFNF